MGSSDRISGGKVSVKLEGFPLGESLGTYGGSDRGSSNVSSYGIVDNKI